MADQNRRGFLRWAIHGSGALFGVVLGVPAVMYLVDPRNRPAGSSESMPVRGIKLSELPVGEPHQGVIRDIRYDAWALHPDDVVGRVWVRRVREGLDVDCYQVFTTVCPHLGCSINANADPATGFTCPCHNAQFAADGAKLPTQGNVAPRGMDSLVFDVARDPENPDPNNKDLLTVRYQNFKAGDAKKEPVA